MTSAMFVVCWVLLYQPVQNQESCTPPMRYFSAQAVMDHVLRTEGTLKLSMRAPAETPPKPNVAHESGKVEKDR